MHNLHIISNLKIFPKPIITSLYSSMDISTDTKSDGYNITEIMMYLLDSLNEPENVSLPSGYFTKVRNMIYYDITI